MPTGDIRSILDGLHDLLLLVNDNVRQQHDDYIRLRETVDRHTEQEAHAWHVNAQAWQSNEQALGKLGQQVTRLEERQGKQLRGMAALTSLTSTVVAAAVTTVLQTLGIKVQN